jgi:hypothetical protein
VGLERDPLRLVSTIEELLGRKSSGSGFIGLSYIERVAALLYPCHISVPVTTSLPLLGSGFQASNGGTFPPLLVREIS